jgi:hypothetical protein
MPLKKIEIATVLKEHGLAFVDLDMLTPNNQNYRCLLMQPSGPIYADGNRIGHLNQEIASVRCERFFHLARQRDANLVVAPEYSVPWISIQNVVLGNDYPNPGSIWVLGAESITPGELDNFNEAVSLHCLVVYEQLQGHGSYVDPVIFLFHAKDGDGDLKRVAVIQFKTTASRDTHFLENRHLILGQCIYRFRNSDELLSLSTIVCSDAFALSEDLFLLEMLSDRATLLHIQLNPDPRHRDYRTYRSIIFRGDELSNCDLICLNWAGGIQQFGDHGAPEQWPSIGGSTWYLPKNRCSTNDTEINENHKNGIYYSYLLNERRHALLMHYGEGIFELDVTKPLAKGPGVLVNKLGPIVSVRYIWDEDSLNWITDEMSADSGFDFLILDPEVKTALAGLLPAIEPLVIERALALSSGCVASNDQWFHADKLDSCTMGSDEVVNRITFAQDSCEKATEFRHARLQRATALAYLLATNDEWPKQIKGISAAAKIGWHRGLPNFNIHDDASAPALVVYLGESPRQEIISSSVDGFFDLLRRENSAHQKRLAICYRLHGNLKFAPISPLTRFDYSGGSRTDFTEPLEDADGEQ